MSERRSYFDHEPEYRKILAKGGAGWDDFFAVPHTDSYDALEAFLAWEGRPAGGLALEVGCGGGQATLRLARAGYEAYGVDFSPTAVELARRNAAETGLAARFAVDDAHTLATIADASVDLVVDNHMLHCVVGAANRRAVLSAIARVLRPGGWLFSETMSREGNLDVAALGIDAASFVSGNGMRYWVGEAELRQELAAVGLAVVRLGRVDDGGNAGQALVVYARR